MKRGLIILGIFSSFPFNFKKFGFSSLQLDLLQYSAYFMQNDWRRENYADLPSAFQSPYVSKLAHQQSKRLRGAALSFDQESVATPDSPLNNCYFLKRFPTLL